MSLRLQMAYPNTWILWFTKQLDFELMFSSMEQMGKVIYRFIGFI